MDINQMLRAHQIALVGKARATTRIRRAAFGGAIKALAIRVRRARQDGGADVNAAPFIVGEKVPHCDERQAPAAVRAPATAAAEKGVAAIADGCRG